MKLFLETTRGKAATDKLFNEMTWLIVHRYVLYTNILSLNPT